MASRVLDSRLSALDEDAAVGVVSGQVAVILSELHLSIQAKKYDLLLAGDGYDTVGGLQLLSETNLMELGVAPGHIAIFPPEEKALDEPLDEAAPPWDGDQPLEFTIDGSGSLSVWPRSIV